MRGRLVPSGRSPPLGSHSSWDGCGTRCKTPAWCGAASSREENELSWQQGLLLSTWEGAFSLTWLGQAALQGTGARGGTCKEPTPCGSSTSTGRELSSQG